MSDAVDLRELFSRQPRMQRWLDVEAALALAEGELGVIPTSAAAAIAASAHLDLLDLERIADGQARTGHELVPVISELARVAGNEHGRWVHWGATTQNIQQTGQVVALMSSHRELLARTGILLDELADLGERTADQPMAGRTHGQHAVPITFGFKVAAWSDVMIRHVERMVQLGSRLGRSMTAGAVGTFASFGGSGPDLQQKVADRLGLLPMSVSSRAINDHFAELVCDLGLICATASSIAEEIARLMSVEFSEVSEPVPEGDIGSSTMPQKRNPKMCMDVTTLGAQVRALVPLALEAMIQSHEVDGSRSAMMSRAVEQACILTGDVLSILASVLAGLEIFPRHMQENLNRTGGLITAEAVMMALAKTIGHQNAHDTLHHAATRAVLTGESFDSVLARDTQVTENLSEADLVRLLDPVTHLGDSRVIAREAARAARQVAKSLGSRAANE